MITYPAHAEKLVQLLQEDQDEWRAFARKGFESKDKAALKSKKTLLKQRVHQRAERMLQILSEIGEPSLANIGADAARAMSVLALHDSLDTLRVVLRAFTSISDRDNTYYQAIPSMTDWTLILKHKPQRFGTMWLFDENKEPFLPTVEDFNHVNERRAEYGLEALRWPKSLAIPESQQRWLKRPLSEIVMREPTQQEFSVFTKDYL